MADPKGHRRVFRAVGDSEYRQILATGAFETTPGSVEGKYFAETIEGVLAHGVALHGPGRFFLVEADVPDDAPSLFRWPNLDGFGPARFLHIDDLKGVSPRPFAGDS